MYLIQYPDVARVHVNPEINRSRQLLGARPGEFCNPPCPGQICCGNGDCVTFVNECNLKTKTTAQPRRRQKSRSLRRNNPQTVFDQVLTAFGLGTSRRRR